MYCIYMYMRLNNIYTIFVLDCSIAEYSCDMQCQHATDEEGGRGGRPSGKQHTGTFQLFKILF